MAWVPKLDKIEPRPKPKPGKVGSHGKVEPRELKQAAMYGDLWVSPDNHQFLGTELGKPMLLG